MQNLTSRATAYFKLISLFNFQVELSFCRPFLSSLKKLFTDKKYYNNNVILKNESDRIPRASYIFLYTLYKKKKAC